MYTQVGSCPKCGAPIYSYAGAWFSILPPPSYHTCNCVQQPMVKTTTTTDSKD